MTGVVYTCRRHCKHRKQNRQQIKGKEQHVGVDICIKCTHSWSVSVLTLKDRHWEKERQACKQARACTCMQTYEHRQAFFSPWWFWLCCRCCRTSQSGQAGPYTPLRPYTAASGTTTSGLRWRLEQQMEFQRKKERWQVTKWILWYDEEHWINGKRQDCGRIYNNSVTREYCYTANMN